MKAPRLFERPHSFALLYRSLAQLRLHECSHLIHRLVGPEELDHSPVLIHKKLREVPGNHLRLHILGVEQLTVVPQKHEHRVGVRSVHLHLFQHREIHVEVFLDEGIDFLRGAALLSEKLVAGEGENFEA